MHLELASWDHFSHIHDMVLKFSKTTPYSHLEIDEAKVFTLIQSFIEDKSDRMMLVAVDGDTPVGVIAGTISEAAFNDSKIACEMIWWMEPEFRNSRISLKMVEGFEYWAKAKGCKILQMSLVETEQVSRIEKFYTRRGLKLCERAYIKEL